MNYQDHHKDRMVQNQDYDVIVVYMYDEDRVVASSANDSAIELDVCNQENNTVQSLYILRPNLQLQKMKLYHHHMDFVLNTVLYCNNNMIISVSPQSSMVSSVCLPLRTPVTRALPTAFLSSSALRSLSSFSLVITTFEGWIPTWTVAPLAFSRVILST